MTQEQPDSRIERDLAATTSSLGEVLEALPDGIVIADEAGRIRYANRRLGQLTGYTPDELVGEPVERLVPARLRGTHVEHRSRYTRQGLPTRDMGSGLEITLLRRDGVEVPVDIALSPMRTERGDVVVAAVRDATERRRTEAAIREQERRLRSLLETVPLVVVGLATDGTVDYVNPHFREVSGYSRDEVLGRNWVENFLAETSGVTGSDMPARLENRIRTKSGHERVIAWHHTDLHDVDGRVSGTIGIGEDVTEQRQSTSRLEAVNEIAREILGGRETEAVLRMVGHAARLLIGASTAFVATLDPEDDELVVVAADGIGADVLSGMRLPLGTSSAGIVIDEHRPVMVPDAGGRAVETPRVDAAGIGPIMLVPLGEERVRGVLAVANQASSRPFGEDDLRAVELFAAQAVVVLEYGRMQDELRLLAVLKDRERIARDLHDGAIQSLFGIGLRLQAMSRRGAAGPATDWMSDAVSELNRAMRDIRNYIHQLRPEIATEGLEAALRRLAFEFQGRSGVRTTADISDDAARALAPIADHVVQIASEALANVGKHAHAATGAITLRSTSDGAVLEVTDDGVGFEARGSEGLGLPNMRARARELGAEFEIEGAPGRGTTVRVRFAPHA